MSAPSSADPGQQRALGFTLIEIMVAMVVAATLTIGFLSAQTNDARLVERVTSTGDQLNMLAQILVDKNLAQEFEPSPGWSETEEDEERKWKLEKEETECYPAFELGDPRAEKLASESRFLKLQVYTILTDVRGNIQPWIWYKLEESQPALTP